MVPYYDRFLLFFHYSRNRCKNIIKGSESNEAKELFWTQRQDITVS